MELYISKSEIFEIKNNVVKGGTNFSKFHLDLEKVEILISNFQIIKEQFKKYNNYFTFLPIKINFSKLMCKARLKVIFGSTSNFYFYKQINSSFSFDEKGKLNDKISITYKLSVNDVEIALDNLNKVKSFFEIAENKNKLLHINLINSESYLKQIDKDKKIKDIWNRINFNKNKTFLYDIINDLLYISSVSLHLSPIIDEYKNYYVKLQSILEFNEVKKILIENNIDIAEGEIVYSDQGILNLSKNKLKKIIEKFPFLVGTANNNVIKINDSYFDKKETVKLDNNFSDWLSNDKDINDNVLIGVIDTWVNVDDAWKKLISVENINVAKNKEYSSEHGTKVSTLIAASDVFNNPLYYDGLGKFKVKSFGIIPKDNILVSTFLLKLEEIVKTYKDKIKLWNLSIEVFNSNSSKESMSNLGKQFDRIQKENDVLFIISAGNHNNISEGADSVLAITVGSLYKDRENKNVLSSYSGKCKVIGLYDKPNAFDFGNDLSNQSLSDKTLWLLDNNGDLDCGDDGSSFSAPMMTRKCAYLMSNYNFSINQVKAYVNLFTEYNKKLNGDYVLDVDINNKDNNSIVICGKEKIECGKTMFIKVKLPFLYKNNKRYRNFYPAIGVSYQTTLNSDNGGSEYSTTEVGVKIRGYSQIRSKIESSPLLKTSENSSDIDKNTQKNLIELFKKYNPNKVIFDKDFLRDDAIGPFNNLVEDTVMLEVFATDLFENYNKLIDFGYCIILKGLDEGLIKNFIKDNSVNFEKVQIKNINKEKNIERIKVKS